MCMKEYKYCHTPVTCNTVKTVTGDRKKCKVTGTQNVMIVFVFSYMYNNNEELANRVNYRRTIEDGIIPSHICRSPIVLRYFTGFALAFRLKSAETIPAKYN